MTTSCSPARSKGITEADGHVRLQLPATVGGGANSFIHVTAGPTYPLVEKILALP